MKKVHISRSCPVGEILAPDMEAKDARIAALETKVAALETKLDKVLKAKASDSGKTLKVDSSGNVEIVTVG